MGSSARCALVQVPGQVQRGSGEFRRFRRRSGRLWCRARSGSTGFRRRFRRRCGRLWRRFNRVPEKGPDKVWEALVPSQVRFNRVPEKVPEKVWEALVQSQVKFNRVPEKVPEKVWEALVAEPG